jgi:hypothetical protein
MKRVAPLGLVVLVVLVACGEGVLPCADASVSFTFKGEHCAPATCVIEFGTVAPPLTSTENLSWESVCGWMTDAVVAIDVPQFALTQMTDTFADAGLITIEARPVDTFETEGKLTIGAADEVEFTLRMNR